MEVLDQVLPYVNIALLVILGLFVLFGVLYGLGRGAKRSLIRLVTVVGFLLLAFFLTPLTANWLFHLPINIAGHTPSGWVDELVLQLQNSNTVQYLAPVIPYASEFALALALAIINIVLFLVIYILIKPLSWVVYAIIVKFAAPKKDADGNKVKKHAWAGALVGLVQGLVLFFFFMLPFNGLLGVVNQAATYRPDNGGAAGQTQALYAAAATDGDDNEVDVLAVTRQVNDATAIYTNILRYTGMEFLTKHAFNYETMARLDNGTTILIRDDIVTAMELVSDVRAFQTVIDRVENAQQDTGDIWLALQVITPKDYESARNLVNKFCSFNLLKIGDVIIGDLDKIMQENFGEDVKLENSNVYRDSGYGVIAEMCANAEHRDEFVAGLSAMVKYLAKQKLDMVKNDALNVIGIMEKMYTHTMVTADGAQPLAVALTRPELTPEEQIDRWLANVYDKEGKLIANTTTIDVVFDSFLSLSTVQMLGAEGAENFILYSNYFDNLASEGVDGLTEFTYTFASGFFGKQALLPAKDDQPAGHWYRLKDTIKSALHVVRDHYHIMDELNATIDELKIKQSDADENVLMIQAIVRYIARLDENEINNLAVGLHQTVFAFSEVTDFLAKQIPHLQLGEFSEIFTTLLATKDVAVWQSTLKGLKDTMFMLDQASEVIQKVTDLISQPEVVVEDILTAIVGDGTAENPGLSAEQVTDIVYEVLKIDSVGEALNDALQNLDLGEFGKQPEIQAKVADLQAYLQDFDATAADKTKLQPIVDGLWSELQTLIKERPQTVNADNAAQAA